MIPCISQATTLSTPVNDELQAFSRAGWTAIELWLTKIETYLESTPLAELRARLRDLGLSAPAAAAQGGLLTSQGEQRLAHWQTFARRLDMLAELEVGTLIITPDFHTEPDQTTLARSIESLALAAEQANARKMTLALEFPRTGCFCSSLDTALALVAQAEAANLGVCLDLFHYYTGPSKFEDLGYLSPASTAWVQVCDLAGTPRELARDSDRILPGDGDFQLGPILQLLRHIGYTGHLSVEVTNPSLWEVAADRVADAAFSAVQRLIQELPTARPEAEGA